MSQAGSGMACGRGALPGRRGRRFWGREFAGGPRARKSGRTPQNPGAAAGLRVYYNADTGPGGAPVERITTQVVNLRRVQDRSA